MITIYSEKFFVPHLGEDRRKEYYMPHTSYCVSCSRDVMTEEDIASHEENFPDHKLVDMTVKEQETDSKPKNPKSSRRSR